MPVPPAAVADEVAAIVASLGLPERPIESLDGFANVVAVCGDVVVRLNTGRLDEAFAHEARVLANLPESIAHAEPIAHGQRSGGGEYLVVKRVAGVQAEATWPTLSQAARVEVGRHLGNAVRALHQLAPQPWMNNPWATRVVNERRWRDAYHVPEEHARDVLASARGRVPVADRLLDRVDAFLAGLRLEAVGEPIFVHTDLHLRNVLITETGVALLDFEGSRLGSRSMELDMLLRSLREEEHRDLVPGLRQSFPELLDLEPLQHRMLAAEALWHLVQLHHWQPGQTWTRSPILGLERLLDGSFEDEVTALVSAA